MRIAVLSDMHAVAGTYSAALRAAEAEGFDKLILLGDLLTYGVEPSRVIDLTFEALARHGGTLILGNHDQLYLDRRAGRTAYVDGLPDWIRESVDWTCEQTDGARELENLAWDEHWLDGSLLIAHANPYGCGDWRYVSTHEQAAEAGMALAARKLRWGVFGHTHRFRRFDREDVTLLTVGSLGQARGESEDAQWAMLDLSGERLRVWPRHVPMARDAQRQAIRATTMSQATKDRLCAFFP